MMDALPVSSSLSTVDRALTRILPLPEEYASTIPAAPYIMPPVGKSGPFTMSMRSLSSGSLPSICRSIIIAIASATSTRLCGGTFVAMPTAMPEEPLIRRLGSFAGRTIGSLSEPSKLSTKSTVSSSTSSSISRAIGASLHSVYLIAAAESPSMLPKLPWPSTRGYLMEKL